mmetsp:Transcript_27670/g.81913  ORF Transcript_27670/g.81913 Transcript_27670/m.81913 type:complete len:216 (+) Transcript_27670:291-938(+)
MWLCPVAVSCLAGASVCRRCEGLTRPDQGLGCQRSRRATSRLPQALGWMCKQNVDVWMDARIDTCSRRAACSSTAASAPARTAGLLRCSALGCSAAAAPGHSAATGPALRCFWPQLDCLVPQIDCLYFRLAASRFSCHTGLASLAPHSQGLASSVPHLLGLARPGCGGSRGAPPWPVCSHGTSLSVPSTLGGGSASMSSVASSAPKSSKNATKWR